MPYDLYKELSQAFMSIIRGMSRYSKIDCVSKGGFVPYPHFRGGCIVKKRTLTALFSVTALSAAMMAGCAGKARRPEAATAEETTTEAAGGNHRSWTKRPRWEEEDEENYDTGDASMDNARNQDEIGDQELMVVVSFGTKFYNDNRRLYHWRYRERNGKGIPGLLRKTRALPTQIIIDHAKSRDNVKIDNVGEALKRAVDNEVKTLVIRPTHLMNGLEYTDLVDEIAQYSDAFDKSGHR